MITVDAAWGHVERCSRCLADQLVPIGEALGLRLSAAVFSRVDSPPFDKSMLDGFAVVSSDRSPTRKVIEQVVAGGVPHHAVVPGMAINVMTGAPIPEGADAIVKVEDVRHLDEKTIEMPTSGVAHGKGVLPRAAAFHKGQEVLAAGRPLSPVDIALLAEIGLAEVRVISRPRVAVLATGNELVKAGWPVERGQITNSNGPMLIALLESEQVRSIDLGIGRDDPAELRRLMGEGLAADILIVTGGVSAGVLDLVPGVLQELGVEQVFHKVRMKPGKPLWFGQYEQAGHRALVFGLPGNPVSTLVAFEIFVKPALRVLRGESFRPPASMRGVLTAQVSLRGKRPTYYPCRIHFGDRAAGLPKVEPLAWSGSADLAALTRANALAVLPVQEAEFAVGDQVEVIAL